MPTSSVAPRGTDSDNSRVSIEAGGTTGSEARGDPVASGGGGGSALERCVYSRY